MQEYKLLTDEEMMEFIILPLTYRGNDKKNESIKNSIGLAEKISDEETKVFVLSDIAVFADKVISKENADKIRRLLFMQRLQRYWEFHSRKNSQYLYLPHQRASYQHQIPTGTRCS